MLCSVVVVVVVCNLSPCRPPSPLACRCCHWRHQSGRVCAHALHATAHLFPCFSRRAIQFCRPSPSSLCTNCAAGVASCTAFLLRECCRHFHARGHCADDSPFFQRESLKGEFKAKIIIALNEHLCLIKSHILHESDNLCRINTMFEDLILALDNGCLQIELSLSCSICDFIKHKCSF